MRKGIVFLTILVITVACFQGCQKSSTQAEDLTPIRLTEKQLVLVDTINLNDEPHFLGLDFLILSKLKGENGFTVGRKSGGTLLVFDAEGEIVYHFNKEDSPEDFKFPEGVPIGYEYDPSENNMYMIFPFSHDVVLVDNHKKILKKIALQIPDEFELMAQAHLIINKEKGLIAVSLGAQNYGTPSGFYEKSPLFGLFDLMGNFIKTFGKYPETLKHEELAKFNINIPSFYSATTTANGIIVAFNHDTEVLQYNWDGELAKSWQLKAPVMDYLDDTELNLKPGPYTRLDRNYSIATSKSTGVTHLMINTQSWTSKTHGKGPNDFLFSFDPRDFSASEINLQENLPPSTFIRLLPQAQQDTLTFVTQKSQTEQFVLYKALIKSK